MSDRFPNIPTRKAPIFITIFVIILLIGLGLPVVLSLLDSTPPTLTVNGLEKDKQYRGGLTLEIFATDEETGLGSLIVQIDDAPPTPLGFVEKGPALLRLQTAALADGLHLYGNAVILNHGQGVSSSYNHLSEIHVQVGERVEKGQRIGLMGATGQATGSHLHWGMVVNGVAVAPEEWTERDFSSPEVESLSRSDGKQR